MHLDALPRFLPQAGHTALHLAAAWAPGSLVWDLIDAGASPTAPLTAEARIGQSHLFCAPPRCLPPILRPCLLTPLPMKVSTVSPLLSLFLQSGWGSGLRGATPLHIAAQNGNLAMASALIAAGANVDAADKNGMTPLHFVTDALNKGARGPAPFARDGERTERLLGMLEFLCEAGANPLRRSKVRTGRCRPPSCLGCSAFLPPVADGSDHLASAAPAPLRRV